MKRLKELDAKTSNAQSAVEDHLQYGTHGTEETSREGSRDPNEGSHDAKEGSHDSCGPLPVAITDGHTEHDHITVDVEENRTHINEKQTTTNGHGDLDGQEIINSKEIENNEQDTSPLTPLPTASNAIGSGLYIVGMHRKMVSVACDSTVSVLACLCNTRSTLRAHIWWQSTSYGPICLAFPSSFRVLRTPPIEISTRRCGDRLKD